MSPFLEEYRCPICTTRHSLRLCRCFLAMHPTNKARFVEEHNACENCLGLSHTLENCRSEDVCRTCWRRHHTLLHPLDATKFQWLQMTALALIHRPGMTEDRRTMRILLAPNSPNSYILPPYCRMPFEMDYDIPQYDVQITDRHSEVRTLTTKLGVGEHVRPVTPPSHCVPAAVWKRYDVEDVADPSFYLPHGCSIVLGSDVSKYIYLGLPQEHKGLPYVQNTIFGYAFFGALPTDHDSAALEETFFSKHDAFRRP